MITEGHKVSTGKRGFPSNSFTLLAEYTHTIGLSIMSDAIAIAVCNFAGTVIAERKKAFQSMPINGVLSWVDETLADLKKSIIPHHIPLAGMGVGIAGSFIGEGKGFNTPFYLEEWNAIDIEKILSEHFNMPVWADNDGNVAALGESMIGVGRWANSFAYIHISSGVGGGIILDGELWRGRHGNAGEFAGGLPSNIYPFPNLELLRQLVSKKDCHYETVNDLVENFDPSWIGIDDWISRVSDSISIIASNATAILDLDAIVLGGRMPTELALRIIPGIELFDQKRRSVSRPMAKLVPGEAIGNADAIGAALLPLKNKFLI